MVTRFRLFSFLLALSIAVDGPFGVALAAPKVVTLGTPNGGQAVVARSDAKGTIHLAYNTDAGPQYVSIEGGREFGKPINIVDRASLKPGLVYEVWDMAVSPEGHVHLALGTNAWKLKLPKEEWGFFYTSLEPGGKQFAPVRNINRKPSEGFSLAADGRGNVSAVWLADRLYASVSHDSGKTFSESAEIDRSFDPCNCCTTSAAYGAEGKLAVLYREETNNERDMYLVLWDQEKNQVSRTRISTTLWRIDVCPMTYFAIVPSAEGYTAVWPTNGSVYFAWLDAKGNLLSPGEVKTPGVAGMRTGMTVLNGKDGSALVEWKRENQLAWQLYDKSGRALGRPASASSLGKGAAAATDKDGNFVVFK